MALFVPIAALSQLKDITFITKLFAETALALGRNSGHPGVRKHIGNFVGLEVTKAKQLRILRNVVDVLPSFIWRKPEDDEE
jgi:hypothetical protein